jgi:hypothetical protein
VRLDPKECFTKMNEDRGKEISLGFRLRYSTP